MRTWNRTAVVIVPKQPLLDWLHSVDPTSADVTLRDLRNDPTIYLLAEAEGDSEAENLLASVCDRIFRTSSTRGIMRRSIGRRSAPCSNRLLHHGHVLECGPRSGRTKTAPACRT